MEAEIVETTSVGSRLTDSKQSLFKVFFVRNDTKRASFRVVLGTNRNVWEETCRFYCKLSRLRLETRLLKILLYDALSGK